MLLCSIFVVCLSGFQKELRSDGQGPLILIKVEKQTGEMSGIFFLTTIQKFTTL